jgi:hypothetical protein
LFFIGIGINWASVITATASFTFAETITAENWFVAGRSKRHFAFLVTFVTDGFKHFFLAKAWSARVSSFKTAIAPIFFFTKTITAENWFVATGSKWHFAALAAFRTNGLVHGRSFSFKAAITAAPTKSFTATRSITSIKIAHNY